jgi:hypothetical protein
MKKLVIAVVFLGACSADMSNGGGGDGGSADDGGGGGDGGGGDAARSTCSGTSFGAAMNWLLPTGQTGTFTQTANVPICNPNTGARSYSTFDLTGDGHPDLVVTAQCGDLTIGHDHWLVFPGGSSGFGAAMNWSLPTGQTGTFEQTANIPICNPNTGAPTYSTFDLTGDGHPDLVITAQCGDVTLGRDHWLVFPGGSTGFGAAMNWSLPTGQTGTFEQTANVPICNPNTGAPSYSTFDLTGDGQPDLVITAQCGDLTIGHDHWLVFPGSSSGFGAAINWSLPTGQTGTFEQTANIPICNPNTGAPTYSTFDLTGDGHPDLVITAQCGDLTIGQDHWLVFPGGSSGFGAAMNWSLPTGQTGTFDQTANVPICNPNTGAPTYSTFDLTGDRHPDLVITAQCGDLTIGQDHWLVFPGGSSGFGAAMNWSLPAGQTGTFDQTANIPICNPNTGAPTYSTFDLTGDGHPDLVITAQCGDSSIGSDHWIVFASDCTP